MSKKDSQILSSVMQVVENSLPGTKKNAIRDFLNKERQNNPASQALHTIEFLLQTIENDICPLVVLVHGIRDHATWFEKLESLFRKEHIKTEKISLDYYTSIRFLLAIDTKRKIRLFTDRFRAIQRDYPNHRVFIISHSFGTYVVAHALLANSDLNVHGILFCGSVLRDDFPTDRFYSKPKIVNDCGARDVWPYFAKAFSFHTYGTAGVKGFRRSAVVDRFHDCGHSDFLTAEFAQEYWCPFILEQETRYSDFHADRRPIPKLIAMFTDWSKPILVIFALLFAGCFFVNGWFWWVPFGLMLFMMVLFGFIAYSVYSVAFPKNR